VLQGPGTYDGFSSGGEGRPGVRPEIAISLQAGRRRGERNSEGDRQSLPSVKIRQSMLERWSERVPALRGDVTTLREVAISDVYTLFTLFSDPAVTAYMAPPPPTLATFAGFCAIAVHTPPCGDWGRGPSRRSQRCRRRAFHAIRSWCGRCAKTIGGNGRVILVY